jgi:ComF family protein
VSLAVWKRSAAALWADIVDLLLPGVCPGCREAEPQRNGLCQACLVELLGIVARTYCPRCGASIGPNLPVYEDGCPACPNPLPRFGRVYRVGPYAPPLRGVLHNLKYRHRFAMLSRLGGLLAQAVAADEDSGPWHAVVPVPMHWRRRLARGTDHAAQIARAVARPLGLPVVDLLVRTRHTPPQTHLNRSQRIANVRGAFSLRGRSEPSGWRLLLVDDVTTTTATANEAARTLLDKGASAVSLAVVAKADPPRAYEEASAF